jgi:hypothetical protein
LHGAGLNSKDAAAVPIAAVEALLSHALSAEHPTAVSVERDESGISVSVARHADVMHIVIPAASLPPAQAAVRMAGQEGIGIPIPQAAGISLLRDTSAAHASTGDSFSRAKECTVARASSSEQRHKQACAAVDVHASMQGQLAALQQRVDVLEREIVNHTARLEVLEADPAEPLPSSGE